MKFINYFIITFFLFSTIKVLSQSYTEKYNDLYNRYEYFDTQDRLIGYKYYDELYSVWKYKDLTKNDNNNSYISPINFALLEKTMSAKQARFDYNFKRVQAATNDIIEKIKQLDVDYKIINAINLRFISCLESVNKQRIDYSSNNVTNALVNYLYSQTNIIIKEEFSRISEDFAKSPNLTRYIGGYHVPLVIEYNLINDTWVRSKIDNQKAFFYFEGEFIYYKRGDLNWFYRDLNYKSFVESENCYSYTSKWGYLFIKTDFTEVILFEHNKDGDAIKKYVFIIGNFDKSIIPTN